MAASGISTDVNALLCQDLPCALRKGSVVPNGRYLGYKG